ncbi:hypothetical protein ACDI16_10280 [Oceanobacillus caeni]
MEFNNFALSSIKIKSSWFEGEKKSTFHQIKKDEGLNLYLQLFRFRVHQFIGSPKENYENHIFRVTIGELKDFTRMNLKSSLRNEQTFDLLKDMSKAGIIKLHKPSRWSYLVDKEGKIKSDSLIVLQATDVPHTHVEKNEKGNAVDKPDTDDDWYVPVNFNTINHMYNDLKFTSKEVATYLLLMKLSNGGRHEAFMNINTMKNCLGYSNEKITDILITLNENYLVASYPRRTGKKVSFYHIPVRSYDKIDKFKEEMGDTIRKFLKRYNKAKSEKSSPFDNVDEVVESDDLGSTPNGYNKETGEIEIIL